MHPSLYTPLNVPGVIVPPIAVNLPPSQPQPQPNVEAGVPEMSMLRAANYYADSSGCAFWRMGWPEYLMNCKQKAIIAGVGVMITDKNFYRDLKAVKFQRQATVYQKDFVRAVKESQKEFGYKMIYEVDDIIFEEDIPMYNACRNGFLQNADRNSIIEIIHMMDEFTVTCDYMKEYYRQKTGFQNITVIPNYPPRFWIDRYYNPYKLEKEFSKNKKRPRVLYSGSGVHVDVARAANQRDDFYHVIDAIIRARRDFKFVWKGCYPLQLKPYIDSGEMEFYQWDNLHDYPAGILSTNSNVTFAPLIDNIFNRAKSNIKMIEAGCLGLPGAFQDLCTYKDAPIKFTTGDELIDCLKAITKDVGTYMRHSANAYRYISDKWLDDRLDEHYGVYFSQYGSKERNQKYGGIIRNNPEQRA